MEAPELRTHVAVTADGLDVPAAYASVADDRAGAIVLFTGVVRNHAPGKSSVTHLEYEAYESHVEAKIGEICHEAHDRWDILHVSVEHRIGSVRVGEPSVVVAVSAAHRDAAFAAGRYLIDELKQRAPIWKKEHAAEGAEWVRGA